ncbi:MAG: NAD(P)-dependent oxidoreductase [Candidatus Sumerlaeota bacterium]
MKIAIWLENTIPEFRFSERARKRLKERLPDADIHSAESETQFIEILPDADVAVVWHFEQEWFDLAPKLKILATPAAGKDFFTVDLPEGVKKLHGSFHGEIMAESVVAMILACSRGILSAHEWQRHEPWARLQIASKMRSLRDQNIVILGFGSIGDWIARMLKPFGVRVTGIKRTVMEKPEYFGPRDRIVSIDLLDSMLTEADHLVMVLPSGEATDKMLNADRIALLPKRAYVHNVGRGNSIDEAALAEALRKGAISGACLDVFSEEPLKRTNPLYASPNVLLTPHVSAIGEQYIPLYMEEVADAIMDLD